MAKTKDRPDDVSLPKLGTELRLKFQLLIPCVFEIIRMYYPYYVWTFRTAYARSSPRMLKF